MRRYCGVPLLASLDSEREPQGTARSARPSKPGFFYVGFSEYCPKMHNRCTRRDKGSGVNI